MISSLCINVVKTKYTENPKIYDIKVCLNHSLFMSEFYGF